MGVTAETPAYVVGASSRRATLWVGVAIALYVVTIGVPTFVDVTWGIVLIVGFVASLVGAVLAAVQAATNGSEALSWLLPLSGAVAGWTLVGPPELIGFVSTLTNAVFLGTVGHLTGTAIATWRGRSPRPVGEWELRLLTALITVTGVHFVTSHDVVSF